MTYRLTARECKLMDYLSQPGLIDYQIKGQIPSGIGQTTIDSLVELGLIEAGASKRYPGVIGWRLTDDGWRCMYGKTWTEMRQQEEPHHPLRIWSWPSSSR